MRILLVILSVLITTPSIAITVLNANCRHAYAGVLDLNPADVNHYLTLEKSVNPNNLFIPYLENYLEFIQIIINEDQTVRNQYSENFNRHILTLNSSTETTPYRDFMIAELCLQYSFVHAKFNEKLTSARYFLKAQTYITANIKKYPMFKPNLRVCGIMDLITTSLPPLYRHLLPSSGVKHDGFKDLAEYNHAVADDSLLRLECIILTTLSLLQFDHDAEKALKVIEKNDFTSNSLFRLTKVLILTRVGKSIEAAMIIKRNPQRQGEIHIPFFDYLEGEIDLNTLQKGSDFLEHFLKIYRGRNYIKTAWLKLGWYYYLAGNLKNYNNCLQNVKYQGVSWVEADKQALWEIENNRNPNGFLLRSRLLFDGGLYGNAREVLETNQTLASLVNEDQRLEYFYRLGRIYHALQNIPRAILFYHYAFYQGQGKSGYFARNAALQLGNIALLAGNKKEAIFYFKACLRMKQDGYNGSLQTRASEGLRKCGIQP